jgi:hypothetical protein
VGLLLQMRFVSSFVVTSMPSQDLDSLNAIPIASDSPHLVITIVLSGVGFSLHMRFSSSVVVFSRCYSCRCCCCLDRLLVLFVRVFVYFLGCYSFW